MTLFTRTTTTSSKAFRGRETFFPSRHSFLTGPSTPMLIRRLALMAYFLRSSSTFPSLRGASAGCFYERALSLENGRHLITMSRALPSVRRTNSTPHRIQALQSLLDTASFPSTLRSIVLSLGRGSTHTLSGYFLGLQTGAAGAYLNENVSKLPGTPKPRLRQRRPAVTNCALGYLMLLNFSARSIMPSLPGFLSMQEFTRTSRT